MKACLVLEDGSFYQGQSFGARGERVGEIVFNTSMTGYQEILTDPSYWGQFVVMTYPLIGNYGVNEEDVESAKVWLQGFVVKECCKQPSSWRSKTSLPDYLTHAGVPGIEGVDTREIVRKIRARGAMRAALSTECDDKDALLAKARAWEGLDGVDSVRHVTPGAMEGWAKAKGGPKVVVLDCGTKFNIFRHLADRGCSVLKVPAATPADDILALKPDGVLLSNGPGDPAGVEYVPKTIRGLLGKTPLFGICLGHQMLGLALGGKTYKLRFGHHGANHPVRCLATGSVEITTQNHNYCVDVKSLGKAVELTHVNLYDGTEEGMRVKGVPAFSVQYHPEAGAGPHDAAYLFDEFVAMMGEGGA